MNASHPIKMNDDVWRPVIARAGLGQRQLVHLHLCTEKGWRQDIQ